MLGLVINGTDYPAIDARKFYDYCVETGIETDWWADEANLVTLVGGLGPNTAHLLLPYSTIRKLNPDDASTSETPNPFGGGGPGDEAGLTSGAPTHAQLGGNFYDRVIRIYHLIQQYDSLDDDDPPKLVAPPQDLSGWVFVGSQAIDSRRDPRGPDTIHLAKFVDIRGIDQLVPGNYSRNINLVGKRNFETSAIADIWGFANEVGVAPNEQAGAWPLVTTSLWVDIHNQLPNTKYETEPDGFFYPEFIDELTADDPFSPGNNRPHNLLFKDMTVWEAFVEYTHKISHELFPKFDGTFQVMPIDTYAIEDTTWIATTDAPAFERSLKVQFGQKLYGRRAYLIDHDHPPRAAVVPHSFTGVFTKTFAPNEVYAVPPIALWRGDGHTLSVGGMLPISEGSLFTQKLIADDPGTFPPEFLTDHPYILAGDYVGKNGTDRAERSMTQYVDCTFYACPTNAEEGDSTNIDRDDDGLRTQGMDVSFPLQEIASRIAKQHLKCLLAGDLGTVTLSGLHNFAPDTRHQQVTFNAGVHNAPTTTLIGQYSERSVFPRKVLTRNLLLTEDFTGLAVVVDLFPADYGDLPVPTGDSGDFSTFSQGTISGDALPLRLDGTTLVPNIPTGADPADYLVPFLIARDDILVLAGSIIFIKNKVGHQLSACDYVAGAPTDTVNTVTDLVLIKQSDGRVIWGNASDFKGDPGDPGSGGGDTIVAGYAIDRTGSGSVTIDNDPTEWTSMTAGSVQIFMHDVIGGAPLKEDPHWKSITDYQTGQNQLFVNFLNSWKARELKDYDGTKDQFFWHRDDAEAQKRFECKTILAYAPTTKNQLIWSEKGALNSTWRFEEADKVTVKIPTSIALDIAGAPGSQSLRVTLGYTDYTFYGKAGANSTLTSGVTVKPCAP